MTLTPGRPPAPAHASNLTAPPLPDATRPGVTVDPEVEDVVLAAVRTVGSRHGTNAADWWAQDTIGGRATGDPRAAARRILTGIGDGDPAILDALPAPTTFTADDALDEAAQSGGQMPDESADRLVDAYRDAYTQAVLDRIEQLCRQVSGP